MIITCEECRTSFNLDEKFLNPTGSKVRCSKCGDVFITFPPPPKTEGAAEAEPAAPATPEPPVAESFQATAVDDLGTPAAEETDEIDIGLDLESEDEGLAAGVSDASELPVDELDLSDLGLDEEVEEEPTAEMSEADAAAVEAEHDAELDFSDLDLDEDEADTPEPPAEPPDVKAIEEEGELDFSDLDLGLDEEQDTAPAETAAPADDELDLSDLDLGPEIEEAAEASEPDAPADDELDLSDLDLGPEIEEAPEASDAEAPADDELDLSDLDLGEEFEEKAAETEPDTPLGEDELDLGIDGEEETAEPETAGPEPEDELNLGDLDLDLGLEEDAAAPEQDISPDGDLDLDDLDLDALEAEVQPTDDSDDLSLAGEVEDSAEPADEGLDLDDLDLDGVTDGSADQEALDDLDLAQDTEDEPVPDSGVSAQEEISAGKLDISELEAVFDTPDDEADLAGEEVEEYDLEFDMEMLDGSDAPEPEPAELSDSAEELDLGDVEVMLDESDEAPAPSAEDTDALEGDLDLELDLEEMEPDALEGLGMEGEEAVSEDLSEAAAMEEDVSPTFAETMDMETLEKESMALEDIEPAAGGAPPVAAPKPKRRTSIGKPVKIFALLFILLAAIGGGLHTAVNVMGIQISFVSEFLNPQPDNVNRLEIIQGTVRSRFEENKKAGKLFIITGRVTNGYSMPRNFISVTGKLYGRGKKLVGTQTVFAGNMLTAIEQATLDGPSINKRLRNRVGENKKNMNVKPGNSLPFMLVFANLPTQLEEFTVEPGSSVSAQ